MATLYITEFALLPQLDAGGNIVAQIPLAPGIAEQSVAIGGTSAQSSAFNTATKFVMLNADSVCSLAWGANPTAVVTAQRLSSNETRWYGVAQLAGVPIKLAVIANT